MIQNSDANYLVWAAIVPYVVWLLGKFVNIACWCFSHTCEESSDSCQADVFYALAKNLIGCKFIQVRYVSYTWGYMHTSLYGCVNLVKKVACAVHGNKFISTHWQEFWYQGTKQVGLCQSQYHCHGTRVPRKRALSGQIWYPGEARQFN